MCYNEELLLPYTLKHYRDRFPSAKFVLVDNYSTDRSCEIAKDNGVEIRQFNSAEGALWHRGGKNTSLLVTLYIFNQIDMISNIATFFIELDCSYKFFPFYPDRKFF